MRGRSAFRFRATRDGWSRIFPYLYTKSLSLSINYKKNYIVVIKKVGAWGSWGGDSLSFSAILKLLKSLQISYGNLKISGIQKVKIIAETKTAAHFKIRTKSGEKGRAISGPAHLLFKGTNHPLHHPQSQCMGLFSIPLSNRGCLRPDTTNRFSSMRLHQPCHLW